MAKPDSWRLDRAAYPFSNSTETRFQDLDPLGHVNNVAMAALFENSRVRFNRSIELTNRHASQGAGDRWLVASVSIAYLAEAHFPDAVDVCSGIGRVGTSSWTILSAAFQGDVCVATCDTVLVLTDANGPQPLPDPIRTVFGERLVRQPA